MSRETFESVVIGKSEDEVIKSVGRPNSTKSGTWERSGIKWSYWYYEGRTVDPISGKADYQATVTFENGRVTNVTF